MNCFRHLILQKTHIYPLICALIVGGKLMHYEEEEEEWEEEDEEKSWLDEEW